MVELHGPPDMLGDLLGRFVDLANRGCIKDGKVFYNHLLLVSGAEKVFMPLSTSPAGVCACYDQACCVI
jgi:hypothetical protein